MTMIMVDSILLNYVQKALVSGASTAQVTELLHKAGWDKAKVKKIIDKILQDMPERPVMRVEGISKRFGHHSILENIYLQIEQGEIFGLIGPSGAGKTTLLNLLVGYFNPDKGDIIVQQGKQNFSVFKEQQKVRTLFGFSTQSPSVYSKLTVMENLIHFGYLYGLEKDHAESRAKTLVHLVGLSGSDDVLASNLSGGMQKRLDIACSLVHNPPLLILDEPTADLDPVMRKELWSLIKEINHKGTTVIVASHFLGEIEHLCDRIGIVHDKKIIAVGTADQLKDVYTKDFLVRIRLQSKNYKYLITKLEQRKTYAEEIEYEDDMIIVRTAKPEELLAFIATTIHKKKDKITHIHVARPSMRELFTKLVKK